MILSVLRFELKPGSVPIVKDIYDRYSILETAIQVEGCRALVLTAPERDGSDIYVMGLWDDAESYQRWIDHPDRSAAAADLATVMAEDLDVSAPASQWSVLSAVFDPNLAAASPGA